MPKAALKFESKSLHYLPVSNTDVSVDMSRSVHGTNLIGCLFHHFVFQTLLFASPSYWVHKLTYLACKSCSSWHFDSFFLHPTKFCPQYVQSFNRNYVAFICSFVPFHRWVRLCFCTIHLSHTVVFIVFVPVDYPRYFS